MKRLLGHSLITIGLLGFAFLFTYKGNIIPDTELWFVICLFTTIAGAYFYARYKLKKLNDKPTPGNQLPDIEYLKRFGEKVMITLDNAEVKNRSYHQEIISDSTPSQIEILDGLYDPNRNYKTEEITQAYIVFYKEYNGKLYKFVSQATTKDVTTVRKFMSKHNGIELYIDSVNPDRYYFDLPYL